MKKIKSFSGKTLRRSWVLKIKFVKFPRPIPRQNQTFNTNKTLFNKKNFFYNPEIVCPSTVSSRASGSFTLPPNLVQFYSVAARFFLFLFFLRVTIQEYIVLFKCPIHGIRLVPSAFRIDNCVFILLKQPSYYYKLLFLDIIFQRFKGFDFSASTRTGLPESNYHERVTCVENH